MWHLLNYRLLKYCNRVQTVHECVNENSIFSLIEIFKNIVYISRAYRDFIEEVIFAMIAIVFVFSGRLKPDTQTAELGS